MRAAADHIVKPLLELGGKSPSLVFDDVDLGVLAAKLSSEPSLSMLSLSLRLHK